MDYPIAKASFTHGMISAKRGKPIKEPMSRQVLEQLADKGLIELPAADPGGHPGKAGGETSSASPAAPVSPQTIVSLSYVGDGASSEPSSEPVSEPSSEPQQTLELTSETPDPEASASSPKKSSRRRRARSS